MNGIKNAFQRLRAPSTGSEKRSSDRGSSQKLPNVDSGGSAQGGPSQQPQQPQPGMQLLPVSGSNVQQLLPAGQQPWDASSGPRSVASSGDTTRSRPVNLAEVGGLGYL